MDKKTFSLFFSLFFFLTAISVLAHPEYRDITLNPVNNTEYNPDKSYSFQINWTEPISGTYNTEITNVRFECNFNGTTVNYSWSIANTHLLNNTKGIYWINFTMGNSNLTQASQSLTYRWYAENVTSATGDNSTSTQAYSINKNQSAPVTINITTYAHGGTASTVTDSSTQSIQGQGNPYAQCWMNHTTWPTGTPALWRDGATWTQGSAGATSLGVGSYTVKGNSTGNVNFTNNATGASYTLTVIASGGGGGGGGGYAIYDGETTTQPKPFAIIDEEWQMPELDQNTVIILVILGIVILASRKKK